MTRTLRVRKHDGINKGSHKEDARRGEKRNDDEDEESQRAITVAICSTETKQQEWKSGGSHEEDTAVVQKDIVNEVPVLGLEPDLAEKLKRNLKRLYKEEVRRQEKQEKNEAREEKKRLKKEQISRVKKTRKGDNEDEDSDDSSKKDMGSQKPTWKDTMTSVLHKVSTTILPYPMLFVLMRLKAKFVPGYRGSADGARDQSGRS